MEDEPGMSMMLSAIASPAADDDLPWSFPEPDAKLLQEALDSAAQSPSSSLFDDYDDAASLSPKISSPLDVEPSTAFLSSSSSCDFFLGSSEQARPAARGERVAGPARKSKLGRRRTRECTMVCWLFRTLLTSEYRALPLNAVFEIFEETNPYSAHGRHWRQSIRHSLVTSAAFVRVLTPNPRKDFLVMNETGSWWTVHPDCELACAEHAFRPGVGHRCPPTVTLPAAFVRTRLADELSVRATLVESPRRFALGRIAHVNPGNVAACVTKSSERGTRWQTPQQPLVSGDFAVVDHEEEVR